MLTNFTTPLADPAVFALCAGSFGLLIGSFINVVIHRLPLMMEREWVSQCAGLRGEEARVFEPLSLSHPRSRCPQCGHMISVMENIPVMSWLLLRGRCKGCAMPISIRYPLVELATAALFAFAAWHFGLGAAGLAAMVFIAALLALTGISFDTRLLPDAINLPLLWFGLGLNTFGVFTDLKSAVIGAMSGYLYWGFKLVTGKEGTGYGDFKLLAAMGAWMGWEMLPLTILLFILIFSLVGTVTGIARMVVARRGWNVHIPFGPYLAIAGIIALFFGKSMRAMLGA